MVVVDPSSRGLMVKSSRLIAFWRGDGVRCGTWKKFCGLNVSVWELVAEGIYVGICR